MDVFQAIDERHSYRGAFTDEPVPSDDLRAIVEAGLEAPSGCNAQSTRFVIVNDPQLTDRINAMPEANTPIRQARAFIVCIVDRNPPDVYKGLSFQIEDCAAAVQNMLLAVTALGYATVWIDGWLRKDGRAETLGHWLGLPTGKTARILLPIGRPAETVQRKEKMPFEERAWFNQYGSPVSLSEQ